MENMVLHFLVEKCISNLYAMEADKMVLIHKQVIIMPKVSDDRRLCPLDPSKTFSLPL